MIDDVPNVSKEKNQSKKSAIHEIFKGDIHNLVSAKNCENDLNKTSK